MPTSDGKPVPTMLTMNITQKMIQEQIKKSNK